MLRPGIAVVSTPLTLLVSLDKQGAVYDLVIAVFMLGGAACAPCVGHWVMDYGLWSMEYVTQGRRPNFSKRSAGENIGAAS